jgi:hypothetical protein
MRPTERLGTRRRTSGTEVEELVEEEELMLPLPEPEVLEVVAGEELAGEEAEPVAAGAVVSAGAGSVAALVAGAAVDAGAGEVASVCAVANATSSSRLKRMVMMVLILKCTPLCACKGVTERSVSDRNKETRSVAGLLQRHEEKTAHGTSMR